MSNFDRLAQFIADQETPEGPCFEELVRALVATGVPEERARAELLRLLDASAAHTRDFIARLLTGASMPRHRRSISSSRSGVIMGSPPRSRPCDDASDEAMELLDEVRRLHDDLGRAFMHGRAQGIAEERSRSVESRDAEIARLRAALDPVATGEPVQLATCRYCLAGRDVSTSDDGTSHHVVRHYADCSAILARHALGLPVPWQTESALHEEVSA